ncbi:MAG: type II secretion system protein N [Magnetococcales bacterium]|nr:type II secretion system protein N [Magnetococcales bacterium]
MKISGYLAWGAACYLVCLLVLLPARWLQDRFFHAGGASPVRLTGVTGTLWSGAFHAMEVEGVAVGPGAWRLRSGFGVPGWLGMAFALGAPGSGLHVEGVAGPVGVSALFLAKVTLHATVERVRAIFPWWVIPGSRGALQGTLEELVFSFSSGVLVLRGAGVVEGLFLGPPFALALGDFTGRAASGEEGEALLRFEDRNARLRLQGSVRIHGDGRYLLEGSAAARPPADERLAALLRLLGPMDPHGQVTLRESGRLFPIKN